MSVHRDETEQEDTERLTSLSSISLDLLLCVTAVGSVCLCITHGKEQRQGPLARLPLSACGDVSSSSCFWENH